MATSLADLRKTKDQPASLPTGVVKVCLDQALLADIQRLTAEKRDLTIADAMNGVGSVADDEDEPAEGPPRRMGQGANPRIAEINAELEPLYARLRESEGELLFRATEGGKWLRWKDDHPPREVGRDANGQPIYNETDEAAAYGLCNASDLLDDLGKYVVSWNGEDFGPGEWDGWFKDKVAPADLGACVKEVVQLHESRVTAPKSPSTSSEPATSVTDSPSPAA